MYNKSISEFLRRETQMQRQQIASEWLLKYVTLGLICLLHIASVHWKKKILETFNFVHTQFKQTIQIYDKERSSLLLLKESTTASSA